MPLSCLFNSLLFFRSFVLELWVEKSKVLGNMDLPIALGAFFHLCFVFDLKYPKVVVNYELKSKKVLINFVLQGGEFVADWLQRAVCMYGDTSGLKN